MTPEEFAVALNEQVSSTVAWNALTDEDKAAMVTAASNLLERLSCQACGCPVIVIAPPVASVGTGTITNPVMQMTPPVNAPNPGGASETPVESVTPTA